MFKKRKRTNITKIELEEMPLPKKAKADTEVNIGSGRNKAIVLSEQEQIKMLKEKFDSNANEVDFNPMICRPYFETGACGFGDNCIYRHDRDASTMIHSYDLKLKDHDDDVDKEQNLCNGCKRSIETLTMMKLSCLDILCKECCIKSVKARKCLECKKAVESKLLPIK